NRIFLKPPLVKPVFIVQQFVGLLVQASAYTMSAKIPDNPVPALSGFNLHQVPDFSYLHAAPDMVDCFTQYVLSCIDQSLVLVDVFSEHKGSAIISPKAIKFRRNINILQIAFFQNAAGRRDAVARFIVYTAARRPRKPVR